MTKPRPLAALLPLVLIYAVILVLSATAPVKVTDLAAQQAPTNPVAPQALLDQTASSLANTGSPVRDLVSLTLRLKLGGVGSVPRVVNSQPPNYAVGSKQGFYVADVTNRNYFSVSATLRYVTMHAYWYVKDGMSVNQARLQASANQFETKIYPTDRRVFGPEASPGIDNDPHITVLIAPIPGVGGYFSAADAFPRIVSGC